MTQQQYSLGSNIEHFTIADVARDSADYRRVLWTGAVAAVRELAPDGVHLIVDLVGGQALRDVAPLATAPDRIVSAADEATATELGGSGRTHDPESLEKITGVIGYQVITPRVTGEFPLDLAREALAVVEEGHAAGKTVIVP